MTKLFVLQFFISSIFLLNGCATTDSGKDLTLVPNSRVCMINDAVFDRKQDAIKIEGKTYYGCCKMCKSTLKKYPKSRIAVDALTGKKINKADAIIASQGDRKVLYFESKSNFLKFKNARSGNSE